MKKVIYILMTQCAVYKPHHVIKVCPIILNKSSIIKQGEQDRCNMYNMYVTIADNCYQYIFNHI